MAWSSPASGHFRSDREGVYPSRTTVAEVEAVKKLFDADGDGGGSCSSRGKRKRPSWDAVSASIERVESGAFVTMTKTLSQIKPYFARAGVTGQPTQAAWTGPKESWRCCCRVWLW